MLELPSPSPHRNRLMRYTHTHTHTHTYHTHSLTQANMRYVYTSLMSEVFQLIHLETQLLSHSFLYSISPSLYLSPFVSRPQQAFKRLSALIKEALIKWKLKWFSIILDTFWTVSSQFTPEAKTWIPRSLETLCDCVSKCPQLERWQIVFNWFYCQLLYPLYCYYLLVASQTWLTL